MPPFIESSPLPLSAARFESLARGALHAAPPAASPDESGRPFRPSDYDLDPDAGAAFFLERALRDAAVLVPIVARPELTFLLTQRTEHLPAHPGQIAFPGGAVDDADAGPVATALREAAEEIGLASGHVRPLGFLDTYRTGTGFRITPVVALVDPAFTLALNRDEVVDAFEVPLPFLMDTRNHRVHERTLGGRRRRFHAMPWGERFIWGATAGILRNLHERLFGS